MLPRPSEEMEVDIKSPELVRGLDPELFVKKAIFYQQPKIWTRLG